MFWKGFHYHFLAETKQNMGAVNLQLTSDLDPGLVKWRRRASYHSYATNYRIRHTQRHTSPSDDDCQKGLSKKDLRVRAFRVGEGVDDLHDFEGKQYS